MQFYVTYEDTDCFEVVFVGEEKEVEEAVTQAENLYGVRQNDAVCGREVCFESRKQFNSYLIWREIFNQFTPNKQFKFISAAKTAIRKARNNNVVWVSATKCHT